MKCAPVSLFYLCCCKTPCACVRQAQQCDCAAGEQGLKRLLKQTNTAVLSIGSLLVDRLQPTVAEAAFKAGELLGLARCHRWLQPLGLPVNPLPAYGAPHSS